MAFSSPRGRRLVFGEQQRRAGGVVALDLECRAGALAPGLQRPEKMALHVTDLKGGIGVIVEVVGNVQTMYYAFGVIDR